MESDSGRTISIWAATAEPSARLPLSENTHADVCIVGAGISGLTIAYLLTLEGKSVVVLDDKRIGGGMTERTTAHLASAIDDRFTEIERMHGAEGARLAGKSHAAAIDRIEAIINAEKIDCDFERVDGYLFAPPEESSKLLDHELDAARRAGMDGVDMVKRAPLGSFDTGACLRFRHQAQFHPLKYIEGLAQAIERNGGRIFTETHVDHVQGGDLARVETTIGYAVTADSIVVATNSPINDMYAIHTKQAPYTTYAIAVRIPSGSVTRGLYWDTLDPYHYVRVVGAKPQDNGSNDNNDDDLLIVGGEDHKSGQADDGEARWANLEAWTRERFPMAKGVEHRWSGQVLEPADGIAFIGRNPGDEPNVYIVTGDSGMGLTHGTIAGILITDLIMGRDNPWTTLYDPSRKTLSAPMEFAKENLNVAIQMGKDYMTGGDIKSVDDLKPGDGAILRRGLSKLAVYRDEQGALHERSAVCRHLGCIVHWNGPEKTWDCPCHGARYDAYGKVINGPAVSDLEPVETK